MGKNTHYADINLDRDITVLFTGQAFFSQYRNTIPFKLLSVPTEMKTISARSFLQYCQLFP